MVGKEKKKTGGKRNGRTPNMSLHMPLNLAPLREPSRPSLSARTVVPTTTEPLGALLCMLDVCFRSVLEELLGVGEQQAADGGAALFAPETPVLFLSVGIEGMAGRGGRDGGAAEMERRVWFGGSVGHVDAVGERGERGWGSGGPAGVGGVEGRCGG